MAGETVCLHIARTGRVASVLPWPTFTPKPDNRLRRFLLPGVRPLGRPPTYAPRTPRKGVYYVQRDFYCYCYYFLEFMMPPLWSYIQTIGHYFCPHFCRASRRGSTDGEGVPVSGAKGRGSSKDFGLRWYPAGTGGVGQAAEGMNDSR